MLFRCADDRVVFCTFTGRSLSPRAAWDAWRRVYRRMRRAGLLGPWCAVCQLDGRGVAHLHVLAVSVAPIRRIRAVARRGFGWVSVTVVDENAEDAGRLALYMTRELPQDGRRLTAAGVWPCHYSRDWPQP